MSIALGFFALAVSFMLFGQFALTRARWTYRAPRLAIALWQALAGAVVLSLLLGSMSLAHPGFSPVGTVGEIIHACFVELREQYSTSTGAAISGLGFGLFLVLSWRLASALTRHHRRASRLRIQHLRRLALVESDVGRDVAMVDHDAAAVYCIPPGRRSRDGRIIVTRGANNLLTDHQLGLVLRHERAHLTARHERPVKRSQALAEAFPLLPFFAVAHKEVASLVEMHADDAIAIEDRPALATALLRLATSPQPRVPSGLLAAAGGATLARARRLVRPQPRLGRATAGLIVAAIIGVVAAPAILTVYSGRAGGFIHTCCDHLNFLT